jgi:uncharacterized membrane protein YbaN (DUF454 family)
MNDEPSRRNDRPPWQRWGLLIGGWLMILLGIAGLVLPFLQGILFILIGLWLLSLELPWAHRLAEKLRRRFPETAEKVHATKDRIAARFRRRFGG